MRTTIQCGGYLRSALVRAVLVGVLAACSAGSTTSGTFVAAQGGTPNNAAVGGGGGQGSTDQGGTLPSSSGGTTATLTVEDRTRDSGSAGSSLIETDAACAKSSQQATMLPINMFIQFDRSSSMTESSFTGAGASNNKWTQASAALTAFFQDQGSAGLNVALHFFPSDRPACGCQGAYTGTDMASGECNVEACGTPLVEIGELKAEAAPDDAQEDTLVKAVANTTPGQGAVIGPNGTMDVGTCDPAGDDRSVGTPVGAALSGAIQWVVNNQANSSEANWVIVLVTDGVPHGCGTSTEVVQIAKDANTKNKVLVYSIGMDGADQAVMNNIAKAGGTKTAFMVTGAGGQQQLINALNAIRGTVLSCDMSIKTTNDVDKDKVNVTFTPSDGSEPVQFGNTTGADACGATGGWYYTDTTYRKLSLCPDTCKKVQADGKGKLDVLFGCPTYIATPD